MLTLGNALLGFALAVLYQRWTSCPHWAMSNPYLLLLVTSESLLCRLPLCGLGCVLLGGRGCVFSVAQSVSVFPVLSDDAGNVQNAQRLAGPAEQQMPTSNLQLAETPIISKLWPNSG